MDDCLYPNICLPPTLPPHSTPLTNTLSRTKSSPSLKLMYKLQFDVVENIDFFSAYKFRIFEMVSNCFDTPVPIVPSCFVSRVQICSSSDFYTIILTFLSFHTNLDFFVVSVFLNCIIQGRALR